MWLPYIKNNNKKKTVRLFASSKTLLNMTSNCMHVWKDLRTNVLMWLWMAPV